VAKTGELFAFSLSLPWTYKIAEGIPYGWWGACKVIGTRENKLVVASLDWFGQAEPTEADVAECAILVAPAWEHHEPEQPLVDWRAPIAKPERFVKLGARPVTEREAACIEPIRSGGGWGGLWAKTCGVWRWRHDRGALEKLFRSWR
jgi:hypothetical protein